MILTAHIVTGAAIASGIPNPLLGVPLALLSHFFLDMIPHNAYSIVNIKGGRWSRAFPDFLRVGADIFFGFLLVYLFSARETIAFIGAFSAIMPDGIALMDKIFRKNGRALPHQKLHEAVNLIGDRTENKKIPLLGAIASQVAVAITAILFL